MDRVSRVAKPPGADPARRVASVGVDRRSDAELLAASAREPSAFSVLYSRWATKLVSYFYRRTWDAEVAADLMAETFAIAFAKRHRFVNTAAPGGAWLYAIASRELKRYRRKARVETRALRKLGIDTPVMDDESIARIEELAEVASLRRALMQALADLSAGEREAIRLRVVEELPFSEVGDRLGCSEGAARVRVHRGLHRLSRKLGTERHE